MRRFSLPLCVLPWPWELQPRDEGCPIPLKAMPGEGQGEQRQEPFPSLTLLFNICPPWKPSLWEPRGQFPKLHPVFEVTVDKVFFLC